MNRRNFLAGTVLGSVVATVVGMFRRKGPAARRPGMELIHEFGPDERIVGLTIFQDNLMVATERAVYRVRRDVQGEWQVSPVSIC